jgi:hypothetical protein
MRIFRNGRLVIGFSIALLFWINFFGCATSSRIQALEEKNQLTLDKVEEVRPGTAPSQLRMLRGPRQRHPGRKLQLYRPRRLPGLLRDPQTGPKILPIKPKIPLRKPQIFMIESLRSNILIRIFPLRHGKFILIPGLSAYTSGGPGKPLSIPGTLDFVTSQ